MELTDPLDVPVVDAAHRPDAVGPLRTSFPSAFPPGELALTVCVTPAVSSFGLPPTSRKIVKRPATSQITNMTENTAYPWRLSLTIRPNVNASANGMIRIA